MSLSDPAPGGSLRPAPEQRAGGRLNLLIRPAKLIGAGGEYLCVLRDVSSGGCKVRVFHPFPAGGAMVLELGNGDRYPVERVWERGDDMGLRFTAPVPVEYLLNEDGLHRKRPVRLRIALSARLIAGCEVFAAEVVDLSQQGACLRCETALAVDRQVRLEAKGLTPIVAKVRWRRPQLLGLVFEQTFRLDEFARLAARLQDHATDAARPQAAR